MKSLLKKTLIFPFFILLTYSNPAQNLVKNPGFELYHGTPIEYSNDVSKAIGWTGLNTADYFNDDKEARHNYEYKKQLVFLYKAHSGTSYAGFRIQKKYKEFVEAELTNTLQEGKTYEISWYISLSDHCLYKLDNLGFWLSEKPVSLTEIGKKTPCTIVPIGEREDDKPDWVLMKSTYVANGREKYITVGNFNPNQRKELTYRQEVNDLNDYLYKKFKKTREAYYYIDDVSVLPLEKEVHEYKTESASGIPEIRPSTIDELLEGREIKKGKTFVLHHIYFEFDEARLKESSNEELDQLYNLMQNHPSMRIMIKGYTDNVGSDAYNEELSERRAKAVAYYLTGKGISPERIEWKGMGNTEPVADNNTEEGRQQNRRVEFVILHE